VVHTWHRLETRTFRRGLATEFRERSSTMVVIEQRGACCGCGGRLGDAGCDRMKRSVALVAMLAILTAVVACGSSHRAALQRGSLSFVVTPDRIGGLDVTAKTSYTQVLH